MPASDQNVNAPVMLATLDDFLWVAEEKGDTLLAAKIEDLRSYIEIRYCSEIE